MEATTETPTTTARDPAPAPSAAGTQAAPGVAANDTEANQVNEPLAATEGAKDTTKSATATTSTSIAREPLAPAENAKSGQEGTASTATTSNTAPAASSTPASTTTHATSEKQLQRKAVTASPAPISTSTLSPPSSSAVKNDGIDLVNPHDFKGSVNSNNDLPSPAVLKRIENYSVLDRHGKSHAFKSLYSGRSVARRVLVIFVRHFFCGNCQEYLRSLSASITPESLLRLPVSTFIAVVGCGDPGLIDMYASETGCPFPIYADPTRRLYDELGMIKSLSPGARPAYMRKSLFASAVESVVQGLKQIPTGLVTKAGDQRQIGGEFLFEPPSLLTPADELDRRIGDHQEHHGSALGPSPLTPSATTKKDGSNSSGEVGGSGGNGSGSGSAEKAATAAAGSANGSTGRLQHEDEDEGEVEEKRVTWCHRMKNTRDHSEVPELMEVLGLDGDGMPAKDKKRWSRALETRKGTGLSMASQMSALRAESEAAAAAATAAEKSSAPSATA